MPTLNEERWRELGPYLDEVLQLAEAERESWLAALTMTKPELAPILRELLAEDRAAAAERFLDAAPRPPVPGPAFGGQAVGPYRLVAPIGQGGMGRVWLAERTDGRFERRVAVKFLHVSIGAGGAERFAREGAILGRLKHPHIADLIDAGVTADGQPFLVLEHVEGAPIDAHCDARRLGVAARIRLFLDVLDAVAEAHAHLIVHRDLKPSNVLVTPEEQVKLLDFGIAKLLDEEAMGAATRLTLESGGALTPQYAAPEQITGGAITTATDVFALGELLYLLLSGRHPTGAGARSPAELIKAIVETEPPHVSKALAATDQDVAAKRGTTADKLRRHLRGELDTIVATALKKNPAERYSSVAAFGDDLRRYLEERPIRARPDSLRYRAGKFVRRNRTAVALAILALAATVAGVVGTVLQARAASRQRDFAFRQLARAERINDLDRFLLVDAGPSRRFTASELLERAEHIIERENDAADSAGHVLMLVAVGDLYIERREYEKAGKILRQAYELSRRVSDRSVRARAACALSAPLYRQGLHTRAESMFQDGIRELPDAPEFAPDRAYCLDRGADVASWNGEPREWRGRLQAAERALADSPAISSFLKLNVLMDLADQYPLGHGRTAAYERIAGLMTDLGYDDTNAAVNVLARWGLALRSVGRFVEADPIFRRAMDVAHKAQAEDVDQNLLLNYVDVLMQLQRVGEAADYAEAAMAAAQRRGDSIATDQALLKRAVISAFQGDVTGASTLLDRVDRDFHRILSPSDYAFSIVARERSLLARARGDLAQALQLADGAVALDEAAMATGDVGEQQLPTLLILRSELRLETGTLDAAAADADRAAKVVQTWLAGGESSAFLGRALVALGRARQAQGKQHEARATFRAAADQLAGSLGKAHPESVDARRLADAGAQ